MKFFKAKPEVDATSLGNILLDAGIVTEDQLKAALRTQARDPDVMVGEALVHMGVLTYSQLDVVIARQRMARTSNPHGVHLIASAATKQVETVSARADALLERLDAKKVASG